MLSTPFRTNALSIYVIYSFGTQIAHMCGRYVIMLGGQDRRTGFCIGFSALVSCNKRTNGDIKPFFKIFFRLPLNYWNLNELTDWVQIRFWMSAPVNIAMEIPGFREWLNSMGHIDPYCW